jgi:hypothetical protein
MEKKPWQRLILHSAELHRYVDSPVRRAQVKTGQVGILQLLLEFFLKENMKNCFEFNRGGGGGEGAFYCDSLK